MESIIQLVKDQITGSLMKVDRLESRITTAQYEIDDCRKEKKYIKKQITQYKKALKKLEKDYPAA